MYKVVVFVTATDTKGKKCEFQRSWEQERLPDLFGQVSHQVTRIRMDRMHIDRVEVTVTQED